MNLGGGVHYYRRTEEGRVCRVKRGAFFLEEGKHQFPVGGFSLLLEKPKALLNLRIYYSLYFGRGAFLSDVLKLNIYRLQSVR